MRPEDARGYYQVAQLLLNEGDNQRAANFATAALSYQAEYPEALIIKGQILAMRGRTAEAQQLLEKAWDEHADPFTNAVRVAVMTLRRKLGDPPVIATVPRVGYRFGDVSEG